ncbi:hypothetical protein TanjilG_02906 [Lupinus angustifolius]|uniref:GH16 domain-containing protein n=1 Tax=Lupinus angustifolius TaxID=3871 RepID=A0A4P1QPC0_LUPAN|nr:hypothetical protein TanjilG_02906 [Lupinus angustifolius]
MWSEDHFTTSKDGQIWYLSFDNDTGCGFQTKQRYRFGWFSMKLKLVGGDSAGVVTAYYMCSEKGAGPERDELDFEFLGNRTGEPYLIQTYIYTNGTGNHEMRHQLWTKLAHGLLSGKYSTLVSQNDENANVASSTVTDF